jgi:hypothetical protein
MPERGRTSRSLAHQPRALVVAKLLVLLGALLSFALVPSARAGDMPGRSDYFPLAESKGGWRSALPEKGEPDDQQKAAIAKLGVDFDKLKAAWSYNARPDGATGLIVIRKGTVVGEWYNVGYVVPSLDLVFVRLGDGKVFPDKDFTQQLLKKVLAAVK